MPDILTRADQKHVLVTPETCRCDKTNDSVCNVCDGGLAVCSLCGAAEIELDAPCVPKRPYGGNSLDCARLPPDAFSMPGSPTPVGSATPETITISLPGLSHAEIDHLRQIQKEVAERPGDEDAMESACGEYNCPCHYQIGFLLEVIAKTTTISLPALRATILAALDNKTWLFYEKYRRDGGIAWTEAQANEDRIRFCDELEKRLRQLPARG